MTATIWTMQDCPKCDDVKRACHYLGYEIIEKSLEELRSGEEPDIDALAQLMLNGEVAPLVKIGWKHLDTQEINHLVAAGGKDYEACPA